MDHKGTIRIVVIVVGAILLIIGLTLLMIGGEATGDKEVHVVHDEVVYGKDVFFLADVMSNETMAIVGIFMAAAGGVILWVGYKMDH